MLGTSLTSLGALFVALGAVLLLMDAMSVPRFKEFTWGGDIHSPKRRLFSGMKTAGAVLTVAGGLILLLESRHLSVLVVALTILASSGIIYAVMAARLFVYFRAVARGGNEPGRSYGWCLLHPRWRLPDRRSPSP